MYKKKKSENFSKWEDSKKKSLSRGVWFTFQSILQAFCTSKIV